MKLRRLFAPIVCLIVVAGVRAGELGEIPFRQALLDLQTDLRLMCVAAHPDDEDGATLAYYRMLHGVETHAVIATRGEGGQNEIGPELYNALGVIRTQEMQAAAAVTGAALHFLNLPEFGYSKTAEETFAIWGREVALERMVRVIRETRPHVIISNHGRLNDHGHHQAIGAVLQQAFDAAADPAKFPAHARDGLEPWQPLRLYIRDFRGGEGSTAIDIARLEPLRGKTIAEIAASALELHESQGMAFFIDLLLSTQPKTYYHRIENRRPKSGGTPITGRGPLFDGLVWDESSELPALAPRTATRPEALDALLPWLAEHEDYRTGSFEQQRRWAAANEAAILAAELRLKVTPDDGTVTGGQDVAFEAELRDFGRSEAIEAEIRLEELQGLGALGNHRIQAPLHQRHEAKSEFKVTIPETATITLPQAPRLFEPDFLRPQIAVNAAVNCGDATLHLTEYVYLDVAPPLTVTSPDAPHLVRLTEGGPRQLRLLVTNNTNAPLANYIVLDVPDGWSAEPARQSVAFDREGEQRYVTFTVTPPDNIEPGEYEARGRVLGAKGGDVFRFKAVDLALPSNTRVGVIESYDDTFVNTLSKMGIPHETLSLSDYVPERLDTFTTIIVDIRAYQYRPDLLANNSALLDFAARGGTLLVMYQKTFDWKPDYAPFPIHLSRNRVTKEDAPVTVLAPEHPLLNAPNTIQPDDWNGWIQERGLYFPERWSEEYTPLIETRDPGEEIPPGAYLVARHGDGHYVYTALGWYRQLRELHPGALRCFANMLALRESD